MLSKNEVMKQIETNKDENKRKVEEVEKMIDEKLNNYNGINAISVTVNDNKKLINHCVQKEIEKKYRNNGWQIKFSYNSYHGEHTIELY